MSIILWLIIAIISGLVFLGAESETVECAPGSGDDCVAVDDFSWGWEPVDMGDIAGVIVDPADGLLFLTADEFWYPGWFDVENAEAALAREQGDLDHFRQYVGFVDDDGAWKIHINGFCDAGEIDWYSEPVLVEDGGDCYFTATYNADTDELESFSFNGEA